MGLQAPSVFPLFSCGRPNRAFLVIWAGILAGVILVPDGSRVFPFLRTKAAVLSPEKAAPAGAKNLPEEAATKTSILPAGKELQSGGQTDSASEFPRWVREMFYALRHPLMAVILLLVGFTAAFIEANTPGLGVPGFVALVCFGLFFWSAFSDGSATWLEVMLFVIGVVCLILEVAVIPGFGIFGIGGWVLIILGLVLARDQGHWPPSWETARSLLMSLFTVSIALVGAGLLALLFLRALPTPGLGGEANLGEKARESSSPGLRPPVRVGDEGVTITPLSPSGKVQFAGEVVDVVTDGEFVAPNRTVEVVEIRGFIVRVRAK
jgi:membrane-bound serine protease (ClpP class)